MFSPGDISTMAKNILTVASRKRLERRKRLTPFRSDSRVVEQFKQCHQETFIRWVFRQQWRKLLVLDKDETPSDITKLRFVFRPHARHGSGVFTKGDIYLALAELIDSIEGSKGLKHNLMVFYRYISSPEHSNLNVNYKALKRQLSSMIGKHSSGEK